MKLNEEVIEMFVKYSPRNNKATIRPLRYVQIGLHVN